MDGQRRLHRRLALFSAAGVAADLYTGYGLLGRLAGGDRLYLYAGNGMLLSFQTGRLENDGDINV